MTKTLQKAAALLLTALLLLGLFTAVPVSAAQEQPFVLKVASNFFPETKTRYYDLSALEDENGDVFITVCFDMYAADKYLINLDLDGLTWDPSVLEFKEAYNMEGTGRNRRFVLFPFLYEQGLGVGMTSTYGDNNGGRVAGNYTNIMPPAHAYNDDGTPVTIVRATFRVLDRAAAETTVACDINTLSLCNAGILEPLYMLYHNSIPDESLFWMADRSVAVSPIQRGDVNGRDGFTISDVTLLQMFLAEFNVETDFSDPLVFEQADFNADGVLSVRDITAMQRDVASGAAT